MFYGLQKVLTMQGNKFITNVTIGDSLFSRYWGGKINKLTVENGVHLYQLKIEDNHSLIAAKGQKIFIIGKGFVEIRDVDVDDVCLVRGDFDFLHKPVKDIRYYTKSPAFGIEVSEKGEFFVERVLVSSP